MPRALTQLQVKIDWLPCIRENLETTASTGQSNISCDYECSVTYAYCVQ